jgi:hypothetical protein
MRVVLFALLMILLPLRGWVSDAMATRMAVAELAPSAHPAHATETVAAQAVKTWAIGTFDAENAVLVAHPHSQAPVAAPSTSHGDADMAMAEPDCAGHAGNAAASADAGGDACGTCSACVACHLPAIQPGNMALQTFSLPCPAPVLARHNFASADTALGQKPPIS